MDKTYSLKESSETYNHMYVKLTKPNIKITRNIIINKMWHVVMLYGKYTNIQLDQRWL